MKLSRFGLHLACKFIDELLPPILPSRHHVSYFRLSHAPPLPRRKGALTALFLAVLLLAGCAERAATAPSTALTEGNLSYAADTNSTLGAYSLLGDVQPVHDPSIMRQGTTWYLFTTDVLGLPPGNSLPIRCSSDQVTWTACGSVFPQIPAWLQAEVPGIVGLWAPDISYFHGLYHLYYAGSTLGSQHSVIGLATNVTLDANDPAYHWVDRGEVLASDLGDDFNAIDPNIVLTSNGGVAMSYGSYWSGIKQIAMDPATGMPMAGAARSNLASRPGVANDPIEGSSIVAHGGYYYLFVSLDYCCNQNFETDSYKEAVGRSTSPQGPFVDQNGQPMMNGGGTVILQGDSTWVGAAGGTAYVDPETGESVFVFHALNASENGAMYVWLKHISWQNDWPVLL